MAVSLLAHEVSDVCLGKPALRSLPVSATVGDAVSVLKRSGESFVSVWSCDHAFKATKIGLIAANNFEEEEEKDCRCIGKVCMVDVLYFLCNEENLSRPSFALQSPVSVLLSESPPGLVRHLEPTASLREAIDLILKGAQNLVVPIQTPTALSTSRKKLLIKPPSPDATLTLHGGCRQYCWLTQEDLIRFLLNSIGIFSPTPALSLQSLDIIDTHNLLAVHYHDPASAALPAIARSLVDQTSVAVVDDDGKLIGEISPLTLAGCDETVAAAVATLSAGDLMSYIDCGGPPEDLVQAVKARLEERNLGAVIELMEEDQSLSSVSSLSSCSSSDEEFGLGKGIRARSGRHSNRMVRKSEAVACYPGSSLVAVMIQALAHRVNYVWVVEEDYSLAGIVTFYGMLKIFRQHVR